MRLDRQAPSWKLKQHAETEFGHRYTELTLKPLSPEESGQMVTSMLDISDLDPGARERILERTEGNPFFVEEVVRSLIDERLIEWTDAGGWRVSGPIEQFAVPDNIQALLLGRLDRLEGNVRRVIQVAAVIGRSFLQKVLAIVTPFDDRLESHLVSLERADLIRQVTRIPEPEFWFRHALTQEAAYNSILIKRRRQYHLRVAEALESLAGDQAESSASLLAHHFHEAGDPRAFGYLAAAGDAAFRLYGNHEAVGHYRRALDWVEHADHRLRTVFERLGRGLEILGRFEEALANYRDMIRYGESRRDQTLILGGRLAVAGVMGYTNPVFDPERARQEATEALSLAVAAADGPSEVKALRVMTTLGAFSGRPDEGISSGERAVEAARRLGLDEELAHTLNDLTWLYMTVGNFETAAIVNHEAVEWWIRLENQPMLADAYTSQGYLCVVRAEFPEALARADAIRAVSRPINNEWGIASAAVQTVLVCVETGDLEAGLAVGTEGLILAERVGNITAFIAIASQLALIEEDLGRSERADQLVSRADLLSQEKLEGWLVWPRALAARLAIGRGQLKVAASKLMDLSEDLINPNFALPRLELLTARAELAVVNGDADVGEKVIGRLLEYLTSNQIRLKLPEALGLQGRLLLLQGRPGEAAVALAAARGVALEQGADRALLALLRVLSQSESQGRNEALIAAGVVAERMAARITDSQLRALFLAHSEAAALGSWKGTT
jgi:tetratricopeptide (TPR) repeat protein